MTQKANINWKNKNLIIETEYNKSIVDIFLNNITVDGETLFITNYMIINIFMKSKNIKLVFAEKNNNTEYYANSELIINDNNKNKSIIDFMKYCNYLINDNENSNQIDSDNKELFEKKFVKMIDIFSIPNSK